VITVRPMQLSEVEFVSDYFNDSTPEHLEKLGVDPSRIPRPSLWREQAADDFARCVQERRFYFVVWEHEGRRIGFSSIDKIKYGEHAFMHLHIVSPNDRAVGWGRIAVRKSIEIYLDQFQLRRLYCEPNAFNEAPNRTLQSAGFKYIKTHMTVPGPLNFHQAVNQWLLEAKSFRRDA
jgi:RimJ/RimL family protein N-acetyltransferase